MNAAKISTPLTVRIVGLTALALLVVAPLAAQAQGRGRFRHGPAMMRRDLANATWSSIDKTPKFNSDSRPGYYVWREGDEVFVVANAPNRGRGRRLTGDVTVQGGKVSHVQGYRTERGDRFSQQGDNRVRFAFDTSDGLDGVKFHVDGGRRIVVRLDGFDNLRDQFILGQQKQGIRVNPLVIEK